MWTRSPGSVPASRHTGQVRGPHYKRPDAVVTESISIFDTSAQFKRAAVPTINEVGRAGPRSVTRGGGFPLIPAITHWGCMVLCLWENSSAVLTITGCSAPPAGWTDGRPWGRACSAAHKDHIIQKWLDPSLTWRTHGTMPTAMGTHYWYIYTHVGI